MDGVVDLPWTTLLGRLKRIVFGWVGRAFTIHHSLQPTVLRCVREDLVLWMHFRGEGKPHLHALSEALARADVHSLPRRVAFRAAAWTEPLPPWRGPTVQDVGGIEAGLVQGLQRNPDTQLWLGLPQSRVTRRRGRGPFVEAPESVQRRITLCYHYDHACEQGGARRRPSQRKLSEYLTHRLPGSPTVVVSGDCCPHHTQPWCCSPIQIRKHPVWPDRGGRSPCQRGSSAHKQKRQTKRLDRACRQRTG